jgi:hypothetical protein
VAVEPGNTRRLAEVVGDALDWVHLPLPVPCAQQMDRAPALDQRPPLARTGQLASAWGGSVLRSCAGHRMPY